MASELGQPPAAAPTTITYIGDDLLREIFILLPSLPSLVRAALTCRTFLHAHAVRSSPAFRRRFRALHPPQLLGFFSDRGHVAIPPFFPVRSSSDPDLAAAVRGSDFFLIRLPEDSDSAPGWELQSCHGGYLVLVNHTTEQIAAYNPLTQQLDLIPWPPGVTLLLPFLEFYIVPSEEDQGLFRMVCIQHEIARLPECIAVFSTATREWQILLLAPEDGEDFRMVCPGKQLNGFVYWKTKGQDRLFILDTTTLQFQRVDLPRFLRAVEPAQLSLGQTNDGELCMVCIDDPFADTGTLEVWFRGTGDGGVEKWMRRDTFLLSAFIDAMKSSIQYNTTVQIEAFIDGFVYLSFTTGKHTESLLLFCLETAKPKKIFEDMYASPAHPYIMVWPPPLVWSRQARGLKIPEDSQTKVAGESVVDAGPVGTKKTHRLVSASQSCNFD